MSELKLKGSGGYVIAELTEDETKKADLGVGQLFLAPLGRLNESKISKFYCNNCDSEFENAPKLKIENPNEELGQGDDPKGNRAISLPKM